MLLLLFIVVFGLLFSLFATQNTHLTSLTFGSYELRDIPAYLVVLGSLFVGLVIASINSLIDYIISILTLASKDQTISATKRTVNQLEEKIHELEVENAHLKGEEKSSYSHLQKPGFLKRLQHRFI